MKKLFFVSIVSVLLVVAGLALVSYAAPLEAEEASPVTPEQVEITIKVVFPDGSTEGDVNVGDIFTMPVKVEPGTVGIQAGQFYVDFPTDILQVVDENGDPTTEVIPDLSVLDYPLPTQNEVDNGTGQINYANTRVGPAWTEGDFYMATIRFKAIAEGTVSAMAADGTATLTFVHEIPRLTKVQNRTVADGNLAAPDSTVNVTMAPPTSISLEADASEIGGDGEVGLTATVDPTTWGGMVAFTTTAGTVAPLESALDASGQATATLTLPCADAAGLSEVTVTADASGETDSVTLDVTHGDAVEVALSPADTTMQCGDPAVAYTLVATDACGIGWDATPDATFAIDAGAGAMSANEYDAGIVGTWTVTGTLGALSDNATLTVEHGDATSLAVGDVPDPMTAGDPVSPVVTATDSCGNEWDATADASFDVTGGDCTGGECTVTESGTQTMTVTVGDYDQDFTLNVDPDTDNPQWVEIAPEDATMKDNESQAFTLMAYDTYTNSWDVTGESTFEVSDPNGTVVDNVYTPTRETSIGTWDVTGTYETLSDTTSLTVEAGVFEVTLPPTDTIDGGTYEVEPEGPYEPGTTVTLTAIADYCYEFDGWEGDVPAGQEDDETLVFDISADMAITPTFAMITYDAVDVTVMATGLASGTVSLEPASGPYNCGTTITATATATAGYFAGWEGALTGDTSPDTFTLDESSGTSLTAHFQPYGIYLPLVVRNAE